MPIPNMHDAAQCYWWKMLHICSEFQAHWTLNKMIMWQVGCYMIQTVTSGCRHYLHAENAESKQDVSGPH